MSFYAPSLPVNDTSSEVGASVAALSLASVFNTVSIITSSIIIA